MARKAYLQDKMYGCKEWSFSFDWIFFHSKDNKELLWIYNNLNGWQSKLLFLMVQFLVHCFLGFFIYILTIYQIILSLMKSSLPMILQCFWLFVTPSILHKSLIMILTNLVFGPINGKCPSTQIHLNKLKR